VTLRSPLLHSPRGHLRPSDNACHRNATHVGTLDPVTRHEQPSLSKHDGSRHLSLGLAIAGCIEVNVREELYRRQPRRRAESQGVASKPTCTRFRGRVVWSGSVCTCAGGRVWCSLEPSLGRWPRPIGNGAASKTSTLVRADDQRHCCARLVALLLYGRKGAGIGRGASRQVSGLCVEPPSYPQTSSSASGAGH
jgi:hypothetical protein